MIGEGRKLNEWFTQNEDIPFMSVTDRPLFLLQHFDIKLNHNEYMSIKCSDGMYDDETFSISKHINQKIHLKITLYYSLERPHDRY